MANNVIADKAYDAKTIIELNIVFTRSQYLVRLGVQTSRGFTARHRFKS